MPKRVVVIVVTFTIDNIVTNVTVAETRLRTTLGDGLRTCLMCGVTDLK